MSRVPHSACHRGRGMVCHTGRRMDRLKWNTSSAADAGRECEGFGFWVWGYLTMKAFVLNTPKPQREHATRNRNCCSMPQCPHPISDHCLKSSGCGSSFTRLPFTVKCVRACTSAYKVLAGAHIHASKPWQCQQCF